jgi:HlyD family secretion protein/Biotin-lipoyl like
MASDSAVVEPHMLAVLLHIEQRAFAAARLASIGFTITNEAVALVAYRQAAFFISNISSKLVLNTASGLATVAEDSPYAVWLSRFAQTFPNDPGCHRLDFAAEGSELAQAWEEWLPDHLLVAQLYGPDQLRLGAVMYARDTPWLDPELAALDRLHLTYGYCLSALVRKRGIWRDLAKTIMSPTFGKAVLILAIAAMFIPIRISALAPAEVVALNAFAVAAPQEGVIGSMHVQPNSAVKKGDKLFSLDDSAVLGRREIAAKGLSIARAEALVAQQRAFDELKSKGELAASSGRVREKEAELVAVETQAARVEVRAERDGIAVFADANDWIGRPVQTGERVMQIANPQDAGVLVWLPAMDAINIEPGAPLRLFLHVKPLDPLPGTLLQTSYQAVPSPEGISAYRLRGQFDPGTEVPRIGLRGTARIAGEEASLGYYLFRRPIAALREWTGL